MEPTRIEPNQRAAPGGNGMRPARLPKAWLDFMWFCFQLDHGEIEKLKIQDGLPVLVETATKKVKFPR